MPTYTLRKTYTYYTTVTADTAEDAEASMQDASEIELDLDAAVTDWEVCAIEVNADDTITD